MRSVVLIGGKDAWRFLQNIITNFMPETNASVYSLLLSSQGKYLFDFFVIKLDQDRYFIDIASKFCDEFVKTLNLYKLRLDVNIEKSDYVVFCSYQNVEGYLIKYSDTRFSSLCDRYIFRDKSKSDNVEYIKSKYDYAIPDDIDLISNKSMPLEYGLDKLNAISYTKGCYIGQEAVAYATYRGSVHKCVCKVIANLDINDLEPESDIIGKAGKVGVLRSSYKNTGIALVDKQEYPCLQQFRIKNIPVVIEIPLWSK